MLKKDKRDSKEILKDYLYENILNEDTRKKVMQQINGIIGAANSRNKFKTDTELYNFLYQKFGSKNGFKIFLSDDEFLLFISRKSEELVEKRN